LAALRVRKRIFDVLRFGTPMASGYESTVFVKNNPGACLTCYKSYIVTTAPTYNFVALVTFLTF
jgi:hypothetical protein